MSNCCTADGTSSSPCYLKCDNVCGSICGTATWSLGTLSGDTQYFTCNVIEGSNDYSFSDTSYVTISNGSNGYTYNYDLMYTITTTTGETTSKHTGTATNYDTQDSAASAASDAVVSAISNICS